MNTELEVKEVGSVVADNDGFVLSAIDGNHYSSYWCGGGKVTIELAFAKVYKSLNRAIAACKRIKSGRFAVVGLATQWRFEYVHYGEGGKPSVDFPELPLGGGDLAQVNEPVACEVELPVTTKMADCLLEIADMPCEAMKSTLVNIAKSLRGLEDCQAAKTVDVGQTDVMLIDNGSSESDLEWRYIVAGVGTDGHVVYLTNSKKWLFCVDINQAKEYAFRTAKILGRIVGHWVEFKRVDILPVPNDAGLFEKLALSGRPKRRTFDEIKERIAKLVKRLDSDLKEQQNRDLWGQVEGLLYSIGYTTREAERWAGDNEVSHEFRPRKQLKWRIEELLVEIKSGQNCETVDWNYCGQVKGLRYALMDTPCEAELFVCQAINGGEL